MRRLKATVRDAQGILIVPLHTPSLTVFQARFNGHFFQIVDQPADNHRAALSWRAVSHFGDRGLRVDTTIMINDLTAVAPRLDTLEIPGPQRVDFDSARHLTPANELSTPQVDLSPADDARKQWIDSVRDQYDAAAARLRHPLARYYFSRVKKRLADLVESHSRILEIGCGDGELLASLRPLRGVGVDISAEVVARARENHPHLTFVQALGEEVHHLNETFDYVIICQSLGDVYDLQALFDSVRTVCHERTRLIVVHYSRVWQPALRLMEWLGIKRRAPEHNWLPNEEVTHLLRISGFETVRAAGLTICPLYVPLLSNLINRVVGNCPVVHHLGLNYVVVARPVHPTVRERDRQPSVSIVVPARNEAGHISSILQRIPSMSSQQEVIFVEGNSTDDTWSVIQETVRHYDGPYAVRALRQDGRGKGDAVRKGFAASNGDVLMILDADLSVPPEELPRFYEALVNGTGEFINGSRMVYLMDKRAMRFLNLMGNKVFGAIFTYLMSQRFRDTLCGTKVLFRRDYERIVANRSSFGDFDPFGDFDLLFGAARLNLKIVDVPVHYKARTYGETNISRFRHGWMLLRMCVLAARKLKFR